MPNSEPDRLQWKLPNQWAIKMNLAKIGGSQTNKQTNNPPQKNPTITVNEKAMIVIKIPLGIRGENQPWGKDKRG